MIGSPDAAAYFGKRAAEYDSRYDRIDADGHSLRSRLRAVVQIAGDGPGELLDIGMGAGRLCEQLATRGWAVSGVDAAHEMVNAARARLPQAAQRFRVASLEVLPFPDESFDVVTATGVLEYSDLERGLAELKRVLRPTGRAIVSYPNPSALYGIWKTRLWYSSVRAGKRALRRPDPHMPRGAGKLPPSEFAAALRAAGLEPSTVAHASYLVVPTPLDRLLPRTTVRLAERLERRGAGARRLATQVVYEARLAAGTELP